MAVRFESINKEHRVFIEKQKMFVIGSAGAEGFINVSPKGMDSFRILDDKTVIWLNYTGSGNETSAHVQENGRMTIMFNSFDKAPMIMKLYGQAEVFHDAHKDWGELIAHFPKIEGARQVFKLNVELLLTSCGYAVPKYEFVEERKTLEKWVDKKGQEGIKEYWQENNLETLDGVKTNVMELSK
jgi:hypothetical protein